MSGLIHDIYRSFRALPGWVQIWVFFILVPVNAASAAFASEPMGLWVMALAVAGMTFNLPIMIVQRGFSKLMALPHIPFRTALNMMLVFNWPAGSDAYGGYLIALFCVCLLYTSPRPRD